MLWCLKEEKTKLTSMRSQANAALGVQKNKTRGKKKKNIEKAVRCALPLSLNIQFTLALLAHRARQGEAKVKITRCSVHFVNYQEKKADSKPRRKMRAL